MDQRWTGQHDRNPLLLAHPFESSICRAQWGTAAVTNSEGADESVRLPPQNALGTSGCAAGEQHVEVIGRRVIGRATVVRGEYNLVVPTCTGDESTSGGVRKLQDLADARH